MEETRKKPQADSEMEKSWKTQMDNYKQEIERLDGESDDAVLTMGDVLIQAREVYKGHGNWIRWMEDNLPFSVRQAQRRIKAAKFRTANAALVSQDMSKKELEFAVRDYLSSKLKTSNTQKTFILHDTNHGIKNGGDGFESSFEVLKQAMGKAIASVKASDKDSREDLINILEDFCRSSMDTLLPVSEENG